jgi:hypothetical protein
LYLRNVVRRRRHLLDRPDRALIRVDQVQPREPKAE